jgi:hypothetical protein
LNGPTEPESALWQIAKDRPDPFRFGHIAHWLQHEIANDPRPPLPTVETLQRPPFRTELSEHLGVRSRFHERILP